MNRDEKGRYVKGHQSSRATQFKKGQHWREHKPFWDRDWLCEEYVERKRSAAEIAKDFGVTEGAILFWLKKHKIRCRSITEVRAFKYWGPEGERNPMYGKKGPLNPQWRGGNTPLRQRYYATAEWRAFVRKIFKRDGKVCRLCEAQKKIEIHHIEPFRFAPLLVMDVNNAIVLCQVCHKKIGRRERHWRKRLMTLIGVRVGR